MRTLSAALALLSAVQSSANAGTVQLYMPATGPTCSDESKAYLGAWTCPGPAGYRVGFTDEGSLVGIAISKGAPRSATATWRGAGRVFGDVVEWRIGGDSIPVAAIIRTWETRNDGSEEEVLRVFAVGDGTACEFGKIPARQRNANGKAARVAEEAVGYDCGRR